jgi:hypothetical protein
MINKKPMAVKQLKRIVPRHDPGYEDFLSMVSRYENERSNPNKVFPGKKVEI